MRNRMEPRMCTRNPRTIHGITTPQVITFAENENRKTQLGTCPHYRKRRYRGRIRRLRRTSLTAKTRKDAWASGTAAAAHCSRWQWVHETRNRIIELGYKWIVEKLLFPTAWITWIKGRHPGDEWRCGKQLCTADPSRQINTMATGDLAMLSIDTQCFHWRRSSLMWRSWISAHLRFPKSRVRMLVMQKTLSLEVILKSYHMNHFNCNI